MTRDELLTAYKAGKRDFRGADLHGADLHGADLHGADLRSSGLQVRAASWQGAVAVYLTERDGVDYARVELATHLGHGTSRVLYDGPVSGKAAKEVV